MEIVFFGKKAEKFMAGLDQNVRPRVARVFELLERNGSMLGMPYSKAIGDGLFELRVVGHIHIRFLFAFYKGKVWLVHGFEKKTRRISRGDMEYARKQLKLLLH